MNSEKKQKINQLIVNSFLLILLLWTAIIGFSLWFNINDQKNKTIDVVKKIARSNFNKDQAYRFWASSHGGVYVFPSEKTPPSPWMAHIKERDIETKDGKKLTLMNPAYMLREMMNDYSELYGIKGRIAGIKYLNPNNEATKEEAAIIRRFDQGEKEVSEKMGSGENESFFLARPMIMRQACQKCHGHLGFKNGSVRGSVSVSVPLSPYRKIESQIVRNITLTHFFVWFMGVMALLFVSNKAKKALVEREQYIDEIKISSFVFENTIDAVLITNEKGIILRTNDAFTVLTGYTPDEVLGQYPSILKSNTHGEKFYKNIWNSVLTKGSWQGAIINKKKNDEVFVTQQSISAVKGEEGQIKYITSIMHDITVQKEHEKNIEDFNLELQHKVKERTSELEESNEELEQTITHLKQMQNKLVESEKLASLGTLVAGISHEINTPVGVSITGITHFLELTRKIKEDYEKKNVSEEEFQNYLNSSNELATLINTNLKKTAQLVKSFKEISIDQASEKQRIFNFKEYLEVILLSISTVVKQNNLSVKLVCDDTLEINSYPILFSQILTNLILNSVDHAYEEEGKGNILIEVTQEDNLISLKYKDDGKGISKENQKMIFNPFFTTNREKGATGLGLNIVYNITTNNLKGHITCNSQEGKGTEFVIRFEG